MSTRADVKRERATRRYCRGNDLSMRRLARIEKGTSDFTADRLERRADRLFDHADRLDDHAERLDPLDASK